MKSLHPGSISLFVTADDRTGALEIGGVLASVDRPVSVGPLANDVHQCVVDIESRHLTPSTAYARMIAAHNRPAEYRCHKMDSGLRGNWTHEARALVELGHRVAVVPSYPDAGRRCNQGVVYIDDVPLLDSPFGSDPFSRPCSNKPIEVLESKGCACEEIEVWDANDNEELQYAVRRCLLEERVLVGPTGAIEMLGRQIRGNDLGVLYKLQKPVLIVCGSLNATSRKQIDCLDAPELELGDRGHNFGPLGILSTPKTTETVTAHKAAEMERAVTRAVHRFMLHASSLVVIGGDTVAAFLGSSTANVIGTADVGIPVVRLKTGLLATKGGGIGQPDTLLKLVQPSE